jgi:hypothetical protein
MDQRDRTRLYAWIILYTAVGLGWAGFARWVVPPLLAAENPGPAIEAVKQHLRVPPVLFFSQDLLDRWREFVDIVLIALALHFTIVVILGWYDRRSAGGEPSRPAWGARLMSLALGVVTLAFLAVAILAPIRQDYFFYLEMWYHVQHGQDPWFTVHGENGVAPLNAYGPLFNLLAGLAWINPRAPKLLFVYAYMLFAIAQTKSFAAGRSPSALRAIGLMILFWNPFPWVEVAFYGHFDVLVGLACLGAVRALAREREVLSGVCLASGVLLKFLPIVILPFLAFDRGRRRPRTRLLAAALIAIAVGVVLSVLVWGSTTFLPMTLAANRRSMGPSFFTFLRGRHSPLVKLNVIPNVDWLAPYVQLAALGFAWRWSRNDKPDVEAAAAVVVLLLVVLYRVGYPQYQMVPFVVCLAWLLGHWDRLRNPIVLAAATVLYFGCVAAVDVAYMLNEACSVVLDWGSLQEAAGLAIFLLGCALVAALVWTAPREEPLDSEPSP